MRRFQDVLFVSRGFADEADGLEQALTLASEHHARLHALIVHPVLPASMQPHADGYVRSLREQLERSIDAVRAASGFSRAQTPVSIRVEEGDVPADTIVRRTVRDGIQLVIKEAESPAGGRGFRALDMDLLRKCPVPLWLCRPGIHARTDARIAVAIDPDSTEPAAQALTSSLLQLARSLADGCSGELNVVSCWEYEYEYFLRGSARTRISDSEALQIVVETRDRHRAALERAIQDAGIDGTTTVHHLRGTPDRLIPEWVVARQVDVLVMGTLARSGLRGLLIGNTAENIVQQLGCSLLALKPNGFRTPVRIY